LEGKGLRQKCGHKWTARVDKEKKPLYCPLCKSPIWDKPPKKKERKK